MVDKPFILDKPLIFYRRIRTDKFLPDNPIATMFSLFELQKPPGSRVSVDEIFFDNDIRSFNIQKNYDTHFDSHEKEYGVAFVVDQGLINLLRGKIKFHLRDENVSSLVSAEELRVVELDQVKKFMPIIDTIKAITLTQKINNISVDEMSEIFRRFIVYDYPNRRYLHVGSLARINLTEWSRQQLGLDNEPVMELFNSIEKAFIASYKPRTVEGGKRRSMLK